MCRKSFVVNDKKYGGDSPPMILAEMSGNHLGKLEGALNLVRSAAANGAHGIKLQTFTPATLTIDSSRPEFFINDPESLWHGRRLWDLYEEAHTPWEWHQPIFELARSLGLVCVSSVFDESSLEFLLSIGVDAIKVSSFELVHIPLIKAAAKTGKPLLVSTGMGSRNEVADAVYAIKEFSHDNYALLKCTSAYPSVIEHADILTIADMAGNYRCAVGISDHCLPPHAAFAAVALGAAVVEKHFTIARSDGGPDAPFSIEPEELRQLAEGVELVWRALGKINYFPHKQEFASLKERPSIYVVRDVKAGEPFTKDNLRIIRPANGLIPKVFSHLLDKIAGRDIPAGTPMSWDFTAPGKP